MPTEKAPVQLEVVLAVVLSAAGLMTSWASYQAALWDGTQAAHYSLANAARVDASRAALAATTRTGVAINVFSAWLNAEAVGNEQLAKFYLDRFPPELRMAFDEWKAQDPIANPRAAPSPFALPSYRSPGAAEAAALDAKANAEFESGHRANKISDGFTQGAVILATAMFFSGIGQVFQRRKVRFALAAIAVASCAFGLVRILSLPLLFPS